MIPNSDGCKREARGLTRVITSFVRELTATVVPDGGGGETMRKLSTLLGLHNALVS